MKTEERITVLTIIGYYIFGILIPFTQSFIFTELTTHKNLVSDSITICQWVFLILGILTSAFLIIGKNLEHRKEPHLTVTKRTSLPLVKIGLIIGLAIILIQIALFTIAELAAFNIIRIGNLEHWRFWPYSLYFDFVLLEIIAIILILISTFSDRILSFFHYFLPFKVNWNNKALLGFSIVTISSYVITGILFPVLRIYGYLQGSYLFGDPTIRYTPREIYYLFGHTLLYEQPFINYSQTLRNPQWIYFLLEINGMLFILAGLIVSFFTVLGKFLEYQSAIPVANLEQKTSFLYNISFIIAVVSLSVTWFLFTFLLLIGDWLDWYNIFIDVKGLVISFISIFFLAAALFSNRLFKQTEKIETKKVSSLSQKTNISTSQSRK